MSVRIHMLSMVSYICIRTANLSCSCFNPHHSAIHEKGGVDKDGGVEWTSVDTHCIAGDCATTGKSISLSDGTVRYDARFNKDVNKIVMGMEDAKKAMAANRATL